MLLAAGFAPAFGERHLDDALLAPAMRAVEQILKGLTPYEFICKQWTIEPERFIVDPIHQMPGLNI